MLSFIKAACHRWIKFTASLWIACTAAAAAEHPRYPHDSGAGSVAVRRRFDGIYPGRTAVPGDPGDGGHTAGRPGQNRLSPTHTAHPPLHLFRIKSYREGIRMQNRPQPEIGRAS